MQILFITFLIAQAVTSLPARVGDAARNLSNEDVAGIESALAAAGKAEKPWLLIGGEVQGNYVVYAYLTHESGAAEFRRSTRVGLTRRSRSDPWLATFYMRKDGACTGKSRCPAEVWTPTQENVTTISRSWSSAISRTRN